MEINACDEVFALTDTALLKMPTMQRAEWILRVSEQKTDRTTQIKALKRLNRDYHPSDKRIKQLESTGRKFFFDLQYALPLTFARNNWAVWSSQYKFDFLKKAADLQAKDFGYQPAMVCSYDIDSLAQYDADNNEIVIDDDELGTDHRDLGQPLHAIFHEGIHALQSKDCKSQAFDPDTVILRLQRCNNVYIQPWEDFDGYLSNPIEKEARDATARFMSIYRDESSWII